jgi:hypothetical protein
MPWSHDTRSKDPRLNNLTGKRFGAWTVLGYSIKSSPGKVYWDCICDCGESRPVRATKLKAGLTLSCGCRSVVKPSSVDRYHGDTDHRLYSIWNDMKRRCNSIKNKCYGNYGGRGITYCEEWRRYLAFREWAYANGYREDLTLERIDVNGNYEPSNCCWIPRPEQNKNQRRSIFLEAFGERKLIVEWTKDPRCRATYMAIRSRTLSGWDHELAITTPVRQIHKLTYEEAKRVKSRIGQGASMTEVSTEFKIGNSTARAIRDGLFWVDA